MDRKQQHCFCYISISNEQGTILRNTSLFRVSLNSSFMAHNSVMGLVKITRPIQNYSTSDPYTWNGPITSKGLILSLELPFGFSFATPISGLSDMQFRAQRTKKGNSKM